MYVMLGQTYAATGLYMGAEAHILPIILLIFEGKF